MLTAAVESNLGDYYFQLGGPALGIFQIEPDTHRDLWLNYLYYNADKLHAVREFAYWSDLEHDAERDFYYPSPIQLSGNVFYAIACARMQYYRKPFIMPTNITPITTLAEIWKQYWNTSLGSGSVEKAIYKYNQLCGRVD